ncbi:MAG TPA: mevalonate kinase [Candidatus Thermoplasmatota archaeon]|nr:mevalonate kinase [Candidatus Thermoplasmatota archaeon]
MNKGQGIGFGKAILFNEHFVVYGIPSIVSAIGTYTVARVEPSDKSGFILSDKRPATPKYKEDKLGQQKESLDLMIKKMGVDLSKKGVKITLEGNLYAASGIGASAASCVAVARALAEYFNMTFTDEQINDIAYEGEKGYHGNPSGVDNTASTYGGLIWFQRAEKNIIERIPTAAPVEIVIGNTGKVANTKAAVDGVKERREKNLKKYQEIFGRAENIAYLAKRAIQDGSFTDVGKLMNENHKLLQQIEVSSRELDFLVNIAREAGALGAKLTGGGLGGNIIALTPGKELQDKVATAIEKEGFQTVQTVIGATREEVEQV